MGSWPPTVTLQLIEKASSEQTGRVVHESSYSSRANGNDISPRSVVQTRPKELTGASHLAGATCMTWTVYGPIPVRSVGTSAAFSV